MPVVKEENKKLPDNKLRQAKDPKSMEEIRKKFYDGEVPEWAINPKLKDVDWVGR